MAISAHHRPLELSLRGTVRRALGWRILSAVVVLLGLFGTTTTVARAGEILGAIDRRTGILVPLAAPSLAPAATAPAARLGTVKVTYAFTVGPELPASTPIDAYASLATSDANFNNQVAISGTLSRSGKTATLVLNIPYYWTVGSASETVAVYIDASSYMSSGLYYDLRKIFTIPLPGNGATTALSFNGAL